MKELLVSFLVCLVIGSIINGASVPPPPANTESTQNTNPNQNSSTDLDSSGSGSLEKAPETSDANFDKDVLTSKVPVLVDFSASWCGPCQKMAPLIGQLSKEYEGKAKVYTLDVDSNPSIKERFQVNALPTFMIFRDGRAVATHEGAMPKEMLAGVLDRQLGQL